MYENLEKIQDKYGITIEDNLSVFLRGENNTLGDEEKKQIADLIKLVINHFVYPITLVAAPVKTEILGDAEAYKKAYGNFVKIYSNCIHANWKMGAAAHAGKLAKQWADGDYYDCSRPGFLYWKDYNDVGDELKVSYKPYETLKVYFEIIYDYITDGEKSLFPYTEQECSGKYLPFIQECRKETIKKIFDVNIYDFPDIEEDNEKAKKRKIIEEKFHADKVIRLIMKRFWGDKKPEKDDILKLDCTYKKPLDDVSEAELFINAFISVFEEKVRNKFKSCYEDVVDKVCLSILAERIKKTGKQYSGSEKNGVAMIKFLKEEADLEIFEEMGVYIESLKNDSIKDVLRDWIDQSYRVSCI